MKTIFKLLILQLALILTSCSLFNYRDHERVMNTQFDGEMWVPEKDFQVIPGDSGRSYRNNQELNSRVPATARSKAEYQYQQSLMQELVALENKLGLAEYEDYMKIKPQLGTTSQKIYFLKLPHHEKIAYIEARGFRFKKHYTVQQAKNYRQAEQAVGLGMSKSQVMNSWGSPVQKQYAGSSTQGNEKWSYRVNGRVKHIYFENGQVEGWTEN